MSKKLPGFLLIFALLLSFALNYSNTIQTPIISYLNTIKLFYVNTLHTINTTIDQHFYQQKEIQSLQEKLKLYEKSHLISHQIATELNKLYEENNVSFHSNPDVTLVQALSYASLGDINKVWLHMDDFNTSKIYGLVYKEKAAGIVISQNNQPLALLNNDLKCSYAVHIGEKKVPGIIHGKNHKEMLIEFIPSWMHISIGDEVVTSGLDNLFFNNILVGKVTAVNQSQGYQNALVTPYYNENDIGFFHVITKTR